MSPRLAALSLAALALGADPALAETVVKVSLTGETDAKMGMDLSASSVPAGKVRFDVMNAASRRGPPRSRPD